MTTDRTPTTEPAYPCINCGTSLDVCDYDRPCCDDSDHPYATFAEMRTAIEDEARAPLVAALEQGYETIDGLFCVKAGILREYLSREARP